MTTAKKIGLALASVSAAMLLWPSTSAAADAKATKLYKGKCSSCHGADGKGDTEQGKKAGVPDFTAAAWQGANQDADIKKAFMEGVKNKDKAPDHNYAEKVGDQADGVVQVIRGFKK